MGYLNRNLLMNNPSANNKLIAKNTMLLYIRMLCQVLIGLYTSRVVLQVLGVSDFGVYNVVGGIVMMLFFLSGSLGAASSRFITYDLGKGDMKVMKKTFGNILAIHYLLAILAFILFETVGLWFVLEKLQIPEGRENAAFWVYQCSIFTFLLSVISVPYDAAIIAHEKMAAYAYIAITNQLLKLLILYVLLVFPGDKLVVYAVLYAFVQFLNRIICRIYCIRHFEETRIRMSFDRGEVKRMLGFTLWITYGGIPFIVNTQGLNILLNLFFGPVVNAARGIAVQVQSVVENFCTNFQMAFNPQITKSYAQGNIRYMHQLVKMSSKLSFFLLFFISFLLMVEARLVLEWWLGIVPEHTVNFLRLILAICMIKSVSNPLIIAVRATGDIKKFQLVEGTVLLLVFPICYVLLKFFHAEAEYVFCVHLIIELIAQLIRVGMILPRISMSVMNYFRKVVFPIICVVLVSSAIPLVVFFNLEQNVITFFLICFISAVCVLGTVYTLGCNDRERDYLKAYVYVGYFKLAKKAKKDKNTIKTHG